MSAQEKVHAITNITVGSLAISVPWWMDKILDWVHVATSLLGLVLVISQLYLLFKKKR